MTDLIEFLRARLDEKEQRVLAPRARFLFVPSLRDPSAPTPEEIATGTDLSEPDRRQALAEVEAMRKIIELHGPHERYADECRTCGAPDSCGCAGGVDHPCDTLRYLASVHASHPEYDARWRP